MDLIAQNKWLMKVIAFFAVIGIFKVAELASNREIMDKYNLLSLAVFVIGIEIFKFLTS